MVVLICAVIAVYGLNLWLVGYETITLQEGSPIVHSGHFPTPLGIIPLIGALLLAIGLLLGRNAISWLGLAILSVFAGLFLFSIGGILIPVALLLLVLMIIIQLLPSKATQ